MAHSKLPPNIEATTMAIVELGSVLSETKGVVGPGDQGNGTLG
jgi:hypothetical protein